MSQYLFDNAAEQTSLRFRGLEALYDPETKQALEMTGITEGWRCLEIGAGGGSIAAWLAGKVGPSGWVLVTDLDPSHLDALTDSRYPNIEVRVHDIGVDPLPIATFDLIHARLVLLHVPERESALARLVEALKPGGWIVLEEFDPVLFNRGFVEVNPADYAVYENARVALRHLLDKHGMDPLWGRSLYKRFTDSGLSNVQMKGRFEVWSGGSIGALLEQANYEQVRSEAAAAGLITDEQMDKAIAVLLDPGFAFGSLPMLTTSGKKPA